MMDPNEDGDVPMSAPSTPTASPAKQTPAPAQTLPDTNNDTLGATGGDGPAADADADADDDAPFSDAAGEPSLSPTSQAAFDKDDYLESLVSWGWSVGRSVGRSVGGLVSWRRARV